jgi:hypothetical protein
VVRYYWQDELREGIRRSGRNVELNGERELEDSCVRKLPHAHAEPSPVSALGKRSSAMVRSRQGDANPRSFLVTKADLPTTAIGRLGLLHTPSRNQAFRIRRKPEEDPPFLEVLAGSELRRFQLLALEHLIVMLRGHGNWMLLGSVEERTDAPTGSVEAWGRSSRNPVGGWYGLTIGMRGRFADFIPPVLEGVGLLEIDRKARNPRARAI